MERETFSESKDDRLSREFAESSANGLAKGFHIFKYPKIYEEQLAYRLREGASEDEQNIADLDFDSRILSNPSLSLFKKSLIIAGYAANVGRYLKESFNVDNPILWREFIVHNYSGPEFFGDANFTDYFGNPLNVEDFLPNPYDWKKIFEYDVLRTTANAIRIAEWLESNQ